MNDKETRYYVWNPAKESPKEIHTNIKDAEREAERIATIEVGCEIFVLRAVCSYKHLPSPIVRKQFKK